MNLKLKSPVPLKFLIVPALVLALFAAHYFRVIDFHEGDAADLRFKMRGEIKADPQITIVAIDDRSIEVLGQWPWPRNIHAGFLEIISRYKPKKIFFDILFTENAARPEEDLALAEAMRKSANVILPFFYSSENPFRAQFPIDLLWRASANLTYVNAVLDPDGKIRRNRVFLRANGQTYLSPALVMADERAIPEKLPLKEDETSWINFPGDLNSFRVLSFGQVISAEGLGDSQSMREWFEGRYVLVGHAATGTSDLKNTPFTHSLPGVAVHAAFLDTLLKKNYLAQLPDFAHLLLLLFLGFVSSWGFQKLKPGKGFWILLAALLIYFFLNFGLFLAGWIVPLYVPMTLIAAIYALTLFGKYTEIYIQKEMTARELATAARIQEQFLIQSKPQLSELDVAYETRFLKEVGGDLYDWFDLGGGRFAFCVGDVSGKGMPAAIYMAKTLSDLRSIDKKSKTAGSICTELNRILTENPAAGMFLTLFFGILDPKSRRLQYASAGHEAPVLYRAKSRSSELLQGASGMPLGLFEAEYETDEIVLAEGDSLLLYTDGVKELRNKKREEFGTEKLQAAMREGAEKKLDAAGHLKVVLEAMRRHQENGAAHDDCTLFCVQLK